MLIAVTLGAILVTSFRPGDLSDEARAELRGHAQVEYDKSDIKSNVEEAAGRGQDNLGGAWMNILRQMVPRNIFDEAAKGRTLGVIMFAYNGGIVEPDYGHQRQGCLLGHQNSYSRDAPSRRRLHR